MIKLLKYDWKSNSTFLIAAFAVLIVVQTVLTTTALMREWEGFILTTLSVMCYSLTALLTVGTCCNNYDKSMRAYNRRLLSVHPLGGVMAVILLSWLCLLLTGLIAAVQFLTYFAIEGIEMTEYFDPASLTAGNVLLYAIVTIWSFTMLVLMIMTAITIAHSVRIKNKTWTGIAIFFILFSIVSYLEQLIVPSDRLLFGMEFSQVENESTLMMMPTLETASMSWQLLFEAVAAAVFLYVMNVLLNKKVEM